MTEKLKNILEGIGSTMDLYPADPPTIEKNKEERLRRSWERTGQAFQRSLDQIASEQSTR